MYYSFVSPKFLYLTIILITVFVFIRILNQSYRKNTLFKIVIALFISLLAVANTISVNLLFPILLILIYYGDDNVVQKLAQDFFWSLLFWFLTTIVLNLFNILPDHNVYRYGIVRHSLGFPYPGFVGLYFLFIAISAYLAFKNGKKIILYFLPFAILFYKLSLARAGFVSYIMLLIVAYLPDKIRESKILKIITKYMFPMFTIAVIAITIMYSKYDLSLLNKLSSNRLLHYYMYISNGLLVNPFGFAKLDSYTIDNYYLYFFYDYGYIGYIVWLIINHISMRKICQNSKLLIVMISIFIYGLFDSNAIVTSINLVITIQIMCLFNDENMGVVSHEKNK